MSVITDYIANLSPPEQEVWNQFRDIVYKEVPDVEDAFSYGIPTYRYKGKYMIAFASTKKGLSIYPGAYLSDPLMQAVKPFRSGKGTLAFTLKQPIPKDTLRALVQECKAKVDDSTKKY